ASSAEAEADTLETGGVSLTGKGLGNELMEIVGITNLEVVTGSAGNDRVIVADAMEATGAFSLVAKNTVWFTSEAVKSTAINGAASGVAKNFNDVGLYEFDLNGGVDTVDYGQESTSPVTVKVDTTATDKDTVYVGT